MSSEEVQNKIQELESLKTKSMIWRLGGAFAMLIIAVTIVLQILFGFKALADKGPVQDEFIAHLKTRVEKDFLPTIRTVAKQAQTKATAALKIEIEKLGDRLPELTEKAQTEAIQLAELLQNDADKVMEETFWAMLKEREKSIKLDYPEVAEENIATALSNLHTAIEAEINEMTESLFLEHLVVIDGIVKHLSEIRDTGDTDLRDKDAPWEMGLLVFEIVREEFSDSIDLP
jgi:hypothetical protein